jgi:hypothetical protein
LKPYNTQAFLFYPFPNTELTEHYLTNGIINEEKKDMLMMGEGSHHKVYLLDNIHNDQIMNLKYLTPFFTKLPNFMESIFEKLVMMKHSFIHRLIFYLFSLPCSETREFLQESKDLLRMAYHSMKENR